MKIKFIGKSDFYFKNGKNYELLNITGGNDLMVHIFVTTEAGTVRHVPYKDMVNFNNNWKIVKR